MDRAEKLRTLLSLHVAGARQGRARDFAALVELAAAPPDADPPELGTAIAALPPAQRAALALFYTEGLSVAEIATALHIPPGTVKTRLMHARNHLRALLTGDANGRT